MAYDDAKTHDGQRYTGMPVGGTHDWVYPDGRWRERKLAPDRWRIRFDAPKVRRDPAPEGSGPDPGTRYHWFLLAHQRVEKIDKDRYRTRLLGTKWKIGHKRPHWRDWSYGYEDQRSVRARVEATLEAVLSQLREAEDDGTAEVMRLPILSGR